MASRFDGIERFTAAVAVLLMCAGCGSSEEPVPTITVDERPRYHLAPALQSLATQRSVFLGINVADYSRTDFYRLEVDPGGRFSNWVGSMTSQTQLDEFDVRIDSSGRTICGIEMPQYAAVGDGSGLCQGVELNQFGMVSAQWSIEWRLDGSDAVEARAKDEERAFLCLSRRKGALRAGLRSTGDNCFLINTTGEIVGFMAITHARPGVLPATTTYR